MLEQQWGEREVHLKLEKAEREKDWDVLLTDLFDKKKTEEVALEKLDEEIRTFKQRIKQVEAAIEDAPDWQKAMERSASTWMIAKLERLELEQAKSKAESQWVGWLAAHRAEQADDPRGLRNHFGLITREACGVIGEQMTREACGVIVAGMPQNGMSR